MPSRESLIRKRIAELRHYLYLDNREGQILLAELWIELLAASPEAGPTHADIERLREKHSLFKERYQRLRASGGISTRASRSSVTAAWRELRCALRAARGRRGRRSSGAESKVESGATASGVAQPGAAPRPSDV